MADHKDVTIETNESVSASPNAAVVGSSQLLKDFETRQHSLSRKEAIKEHWKPIVSSLHTDM